jgi:hypothetical protein
LKSIVEKLYSMETRVIVSAWSDTMRDLFASRLPLSVSEKLGSFASGADPQTWLNEQRQLGYSSLSLNYISLPQPYDEFVQLTNQRFLSLVLWTVDTVDGYSDLISKVSGVITNDCRFMKQALTEKRVVETWVAALAGMSGFLLGGVMVAIVFVCWYKRRGGKTYQTFDMNN